MTIEPNSICRKARRTSFRTDSSSSRSPAPAEEPFVGEALSLSVTATLLQECYRSVKYLSPNAGREGVPGGEITPHEKTDRYRARPCPAGRLRTVGADRCPQALPRQGPRDLRGGGRLPDECLRRDPQPLRR